jgi:hypothetical protein
MRTARPILRQTLARLLGGLPFVAVLAYVLLPGMLAVHAATAHPGGHAHAVVDPCGEGHTHHHESSHDDEPVSCDLCSHLGTLAQSAQPTSPALLVTIDVNSPEVAFTPTLADVPSDLADRPAAPRGPPTL